MGIKLTKTAKNMFTASDLNFLESKGIEQTQIESQIERFKTGFPAISIARAARSGDGIISLNDSDVERLVNQFDTATGLKIVKFVPASGAATRMMKELFEFVDSDKESSAVDALYEQITQFPFYADLLSAGVDMNSKKAVVSAILSEPLFYGKYPKGVIKFHTSSDGSALTPICEHLVEAAIYGAKDGQAFVHFTVSDEHVGLFQTEVLSAKPKVENQFGVQLNVSYSTQKPSTDTIAVSPENAPIRKASGDLLLRPAGHGALIENLNEIDADMIFVKNIDNVQIRKNHATSTSYKKVLGAIALEIKAQIAIYINEIDNGTADPGDIINFVEQNLGYRFGSSTNFEHLYSILNRPVRVCGMVKNEGEPGGGPFWVNSSDGEMSLQILESAQISDCDKHLMSEATHFNPVDLVCLVKDSQGVKFDLREYVDAEAGLISEKSFEGNPLKALELPGLWNGAMSRWNTVFVEVPILTFSPVKTIVDLLRPEHQ